MHVKNSTEFVKQKLKTSEFRDVYSEKLLIAGMLKYGEILRKCNKEVKDSIFSSDRCRNIYNATLEFYNKENIVLDTGAFELFLENKPKTERFSYKKFWRAIVKLKKKVKLATSYAIIVKLNRLFKGRMIEYGIASTIEQLREAVQGGYDLIDKARDKYLEIIPNLEEKNSPSFIYDPVEYYEKFKTQHKAIQKDPTLLQAVPTGLQPLDDIIGGLRPSEFGLITAGTGTGKSIMLGDFAFHSWKCVGDTLYTTIEMPGSQLSERIYCRMSGILYEKFRRYRLSDDDWKRLDDKIGKAKGNEYRFRLLDLPQSISVKGLKMEIEEFIRRNFEPKLIVIDYMNILQGGLNWDKQLEIAMDVKQQIARYFKIATWSANQLMGSKHDKETVKIGDMAFAKNIVDNVDIGIGIGLTDLSEDEDLFNISFTKTRDFKGKSFTIRGDRSRMTFTRAKDISVETQKGLKKKKIGGKIKV